MVLLKMLQDPQFKILKSSSLNPCIVIFNILFSRKKNNMNELQGSALIF